MSTLNQHAIRKEAHLSAMPKFIKVAGYQVHDARDRYGRRKPKERPLGFSDLQMEYLRDLVAWI